MQAQTFWRASLPPLTTFPWFDRAAGFPSPRPQDADAGACRSCQGWPLFAATEDLALIRPSTTACSRCRAFGYRQLTVCRRRYPGSRFSTRSTKAAATSGPKRRAAMSTTGSPLLARPNDFRRSRLHLRPEGQRVTSSRGTDGSLQTTIRQRRDRSSGTEPQTARCCAE